MKLTNPQKAKNERRHTPIPGLVNYLAWYNNNSNLVINQHRAQDTVQAQDEPELSIGERTLQLIKWKLENGNPQDNNRSKR